MYIDLGHGEVSVKRILELGGILKPLPDYTIMWSPIHAMSS